MNKVLIPVIIVILSTGTRCGYLSGRGYAIDYVLSAISTAARGDGGGEFPASDRGTGASSSDGRSGDTGTVHGTNRGSETAGIDTAAAPDKKSGAIKKNALQQDRKSGGSSAEDSVRPDADTDIRAPRRDTYGRSGSAAGGKSVAGEKTARQPAGREPRKSADTQLSSKTGADAQRERKDVKRQSESKAPVNGAGGKETAAVLKKTDGAATPEKKLPAEKKEAAGTETAVVPEKNNGTAPDNKETEGKAAGKETAVVLKKNGGAATQEKKGITGKKEISAAGNEIKPGPLLEKPRVDVPEVR